MCRFMIWFGRGWKEKGLPTQHQLNKEIRKYKPMESSFNIKKLLTAMACGLSASVASAVSVQKPNIVVFFCDDLGYGDIGCYGSKSNHTPNLDKLSAEGMRFTDFYVTAPVCSPSRSSMMTGCYPLRVDLARSSAGPYVLLPGDKKGINPSETTMAEMLHDSGYATACIGKWHLGDQPQFMPNKHGFDYFYGIPYSNDMKRKGPRRGETENRGHHLPLFRNETIIELSPDQRMLTQNLTREAVTFIRNNKNRPFFVYLPHVMPHRPHYASEEFAGKSGNGLYADVIEELDWSVGEVLRTLQEAGLDQNTLVIFTSDNGATSSGSNLPLRGGKGNIWEGGMRVPCLMRWPGTIPAGQTCEELITVMDFLPTFAGLSGGNLPRNRIDGKDIYALMNGKPDARSPYEKFFYYRIDQLRAVRSGDWKLHLPVDPTIEGWDGVRRGKAELALYNLRNDIAETTNVAAQHPDVVKRLTAFAAEARIEIGDWEFPATSQRKAGWEENPLHPATTTNIKPTDWIGNPDSHLYKSGN
jgi:arylsulfatase A-like enzyme